MKFRLKTPGGSELVSFALNGKHNVLNALAAAAAAFTLGMCTIEIANGLSSVTSPSQRGEVIYLSTGITVINDSYNSNPAALLSMVETLVNGSAPGSRRIVVAGEMLERGRSEAELHREAGKSIAATGVEILIGVRGLAQEMVTSALANGLNEAYFAEDSEAAGRMLAEMVRPGDVVLVKGSRGVQTEKVLEHLQLKFGNEGRANGSSI
jgi:UDP-N-acetylmuramoyl-tripeptide--D-alanyl-D-alanine ligase